MARMGIYVPDAKMAELKKWERDLKRSFSQLALEAFEREIQLREILKKWEGNDMKEVIERLKREQQDDFVAGKKAGAEKGAKWASRHASLADLRRIAERGLEPADDVEDILNECGNPCDPLEEWPDAQGRDLESFRAGAAEGFADGAGCVWNAIAHEFPPLPAPGRGGLRGRLGPRELRD